MVSIILFITLSAFSGYSLIRFIMYLWHSHQLKQEFKRYAIPTNRMLLSIEKYGVRNRTYIVQSSKTFAFCFGIIKPNIYLSSTLVKQMTKRELEAIVLHEKYHIEHRDSSIMLIANTLSFLFPFFPILNEYTRSYKIQREIAADRQAIKTMGTDVFIATILKKLLLVPSLQLSTATSIGDAHTLLPRIYALAGKHYNNRFSLNKILISTASSVVLTFLLIIPVHAMEVHSHTQDVMMVCLQGQGCLNSCTNITIAKPYVIPYSTDNVSRPFSPLHKVTY